MITDLTRFSAVAATCMLFAIGANAEAVAKPPVDLAKPPVELAKPSAQVAKTTGKVCAEGDGPATNTTIIQAMFPGQFFNFTENTAISMLAFDDNKDGLLQQDELNEFFVTNGNYSAAYTNLFKDFDLDGDKGINAQELNAVMEQIANVTFTGCAGLCNAVQAKLDSCHFLDDVDMRNGTTADAKHVKDQQDAYMLLASCRLGYPEFDKFGKCVKESPCDGISKCVEKGRRCPYGICNLLEIGVIEPHSSNLTSAIRTDEKSIKASHTKGRWYWAALLATSATSGLALRGLLGGGSALLTMGSAAGLVVSVALIVFIIHRTYYRNSMYLVN